MISNFTAKLKESLVSVLPVMAIVALLHLSIAPLPAGKLLQFVVGGGLLILGLSIFLLGADLGMVPFGQRVGSTLTHQRSLPLILVATFVIGFAITIAEPDVQVLANQVHNVNPNIDRGRLLTMIAIGVGLFTLIGTARIVFRMPLRWLLIVFYVLVFIICGFAEPAFVSVAFDSGGATTGPITVPFIMAMGIGVAATTKRKGGDDSSFGLVGLASIGPVAAVAIMGLMSKGRIQGVEDAGLVQTTGLAAAFLSILPDLAHEIFLALLPIVLIFFFFQLTLLHLPGQQLKRMLSGFVYAFIGLVIFMTGVNGGFSGTGQALGVSLGTGCSDIALIGVGLLLGAVVVCAEPAVWVLTEQVEEVSGGYIRRPIMLAALSISIAVAVALGMIRVVSGLSIWWILIPGYALALALTKTCPPLFTAIAFDSGGVASGPMATTFVLSLTLGASHAVGGNPTTDAFGMIAMIAMAPLITIQLLGLILKAKERQKMKQELAKAGETAL